MLAQMNSFINCSFLQLYRVLAGFTDQVVTDLARYAWKYAASRGITGTPQFLVNGVHIPEAPDFSKQQWEELISKLLSSPAI